MTDNVKLGFVCVQNAGRSQMAYAFAEREIEARGLNEEVSIVTGGPDRRITSTRKYSRR